jgi:hypothetical protein
LTILEPYASLAYRTIKLALSARQSSFGARPVIASSDHLKLLDHQRRSRVEAAYVWAVMDGFFLATPTFEKYDSQGAFKAITHIFVVGDLDGLDRLRARLGRPLELLLDAAVCDPLVERLAHAGSWARLKFGLLPSSVYAINDRVKALRQGLIVHETVKPLGPLLFAGNDGIEPVRQMLATCLEQTLDTSEIEVINSAFAKVRMSGAQSSNSDSALACQICAAFDALSQFARSSIARSRNAHFPFDEHGISTIVYKALFRHAVLDRLRHLRLVETIYPPRNVSVYTRSRFNSRRMLDFGSTNGFEVLYPRTLDCRLYGKTIVSCNDACKSAFLNGRPDAQALEGMLTGVFAAAKAAVSPQPN